MRYIVFDGLSCIVDSQITNGSHMALPIDPHVQCLLFCFEIERNVLYSISNSKAIAQPNQNNVHQQSNKQITGESKKHTHIEEKTFPKCICVAHYENCRQIYNSLD